MEQVFKVSSGFRIVCWVLAVVSCVIFILLPFGILLIFIAYKAEVRMTQDTLEARWIGRRVARWNEITEMSWGRSTGIIRTAMRPLRFVASSAGKTIQGNIPVGVFERSDELVAELQKRAGRQIA